MSASTGIEWTDATWNPIRGCSRVSEGCRNCYAESVAYRFSGPGGAYEGLVTIGSDGTRKRQWNGNIRFVEEHLLDPLRWKGKPMYHPEHGNRPVAYGPLRIFVNSMSDLFHDGVPTGVQDAILAVIAMSPRHTFQVLTKRARTMYHVMSDPGRRAAVQAKMDWLHEHGNLPKGESFPRFVEQWPLENLWLLTSVEDQPTAHERIQWLLRTPAAVRGISAEPLLGGIELDDSWIYPDCHECGLPISRGWHDCPHPNCDATRPWKGSALLDWVICGGESGSGARPMRAAWAQGLRDQCVAAGVPFFFKQWGEWLGERQDAPSYFEECGTRVINASDEPIRIGKKKAGALLDGREWREFPDAR